MILLIFDNDFEIIEGESGLDFPESKKYQIIYADPPWQYNKEPNKGGRSPETHYKTMTLEDICNLSVSSITEKNAVLFIWVTFPKLFESEKVIKSWGFIYKTIGFVWVKKNKRVDSWFWGMGGWTRSNVELCLIGIKGNLKPITHSIHQIVSTSVERHSQKPKEIRNRIVQLMGDLPRIELFARHEVPGWDCWGDEKSKIGLLF